MDVVIGLKRPENYSPEDGARFQVHFEKLRGRVENGGAIPFEAAIEAFSTGGREGVKWIFRDLTNPVLEHAADLFREGQSVRLVAEALGISKSECGRLRLRLIEDGVLDVSETMKSVKGQQL